MLKEESPSDGGDARGVSLSTEKQGIKLGRKITCNICMPTKVGAS